MSEATFKTTTAEALLGLLSVAPRTGYELKQRIDFGIANFWNESYGQIYPTLKKLEADGLVTSEEAGRAGRRVYTISSAGHARLQAWLEIPAKPQVPRDELLLKLFFGLEAPVATMQAQVETFRARCAGKLAQYEVQAAYLREQLGDKPHLPYFMMTLSFGLRRLRMQMEWADETQATLKELAAHENDSREPQRWPEPEEAEWRGSDAR